jgi:glycine/D-amino acid oxidase-like deaminating enzyme
VVTTARGTLRARALVLATNAYTGEFAPKLRPEVAREVVPVLSWQMADPAGRPQRRGHDHAGPAAMSDTHGELYFARWDARGRLVTGGAVAIPVNQAERLRPYIARGCSGSGRSWDPARDSPSTMCGAAKSA